MKWCTGVCMAFPDIGYVCEFLAIYVCVCACHGEQGIEFGTYVNIFWRKMSCH